jgi:hypothetical protein
MCLSEILTTRLKYHFFHQDLDTRFCSFSSSSAYISVFIFTMNGVEERWEFDLLELIRTPKMFPWNFATYLPHYMALLHTERWFSGYVAL